LLPPDAVEFYIDNPVEFTKDIIRVTPDDIQGDILNSVANNQLTSVRSGHGIGKSALQSWIIIWFMSTRLHPKIPCTAPTKHQLYDILWAEVAKWLNQSLLKNEFEWTYEKLYYKPRPETWFAVPRTATKPDALQGFHAESIMYILDEASGIPDKIFEPVLGALSTDDAKLLMCGNPTQLSGFFFDSHNKNRAIYNTFKVSGENSNRVSKDFIKMIIDMYGEDSDVYRVRVAGEFPKAMPDSFIPLDWAEKNSTKQLAVIEPFVIDIGVDVARFGDDESVICSIFNKMQEQKPEIHFHNDTMQLAGRVVQTIDRYMHKYPNAKINVKIDCDGLGVGVYDRLKEQRLRINLYECHFGGKGGKLKDNDPIKFSNCTGLMWGTLREKLRNNNISLFYDDLQITQISNRKYRINSNGEVELERKEEMKKRGLKSPDRADALVLALYESNKAGTIQVRNL
jgi:phage terminase large subunit